MEVNRKKKELVCGLVESARKFRFCGPSDDPDEITSATAGFRHLVIQFQRLAAPMLSPPDQERLERINVVIDDLYSAYDAHSEIEALLPDIEAALEMLDDGKSELSAMPSNEVLLQQVHSLRTMLINVGTGIARIQDVEEEYTRVRRDLASKLRELGIADVNGFFSLWDWYKHWKENGLASYQSRRDYINGLYKPLIEALERGTAAERDSVAPEEFSIRHGYTNTSDAEITIREEAPAELRRTVLEIALQTGWDYDDLLNVAVRIGKQPWELPVPIESRTQPRIQIQKLMAEWEWYQVYDFIERIYDRMMGWSVPVTDAGHPSDDFQDLLNRYFCYAGIGWQLRGNRIVSRGSEAFETVIRKAAPALAETSQETARREVHEALADLSRRPQPDITGAIQHAIAALECVARTVSGDASPTLGALLKQHPGLIPKPLDVAVEKAWGYASERARHIREGKEPSRGEAELVVGIAASVATYLARQIS